MADLILEFCRYEDGEDKVRCLAVDMDNLLWQTRWITRGGAWRQPAKLAPDLQKLFEINRPKEEAGVIWISHRAEWLAAILMTVAPEEDIRELAMTKAEHRRLELG